MTHDLKIRPKTSTDVYRVGPNSCVSVIGFGFSVKGSRKGKHLTGPPYFEKHPCSTQSWSLLARGQQTRGQQTGRNHGSSCWRLSNEPRVPPYRKPPLGIHEAHSMSHSLPIALDCYWVGSLDCNIFGKKCWVFSTKLTPHKVDHFLPGRCNQGIGHPARCPGSPRPKRRGRRRPGTAWGPRCGRRRRPRRWEGGAMGSAFGGYPARFAGKPAGKPLFLSFVFLSFFFLEARGVGKGTILGQTH